MKLIDINNIKYDIDDKYIDYSPYLSTLRDTNIGKDINDEGYILIHLNIKDYITFLETGIINSLTYDKDVFDYMGHDNTYQYPDEYFRIRLEDRWIRDNMYKYGLIDQQLYGLVKVDSINTLDDIDVIKKMFRGVSPIIAGGAVLYLAGVTDRYEDIDVFFVGGDCDRVTNILTKHKKKFFFNDRCATSRRDNYQVIFRKYRSISEIVHGFDIDCCGFLLYDGNIYCTKRALYSIKNKVNWFDPDRMSPSYVYRLCKYARRGYNIELPSITPSNFNLKLFYKNMFSDMDIYEQTLDLDETIPSQEYINYHNFVVEIGLNPTIKKILSIRYMDRIRCNIETRQNIYSRMKNRLDMGKQVNMLLIVKYLHLYPRIIKSDYNDKSKKNTGIMPEWLEQDPMTQITSTFNPEPIDDIHDYYSKSDYYITTL